MSARVIEILRHDPEASNPVMLGNYSKYLWQLFNASGLRARDHSSPAVEGNGANMLFVAGAKQLYRGYFGDTDVARNSLSDTSNHANEQLRTFVARVNRATGKMRLVELQRCHLGHVSHDRNTQPKGASEVLDPFRLRALHDKFNSRSSRQMLKRLQGKRFDLGFMDKNLRQTLADCALKNEPVDAADAGNDALEHGRMETDIRAMANPEARTLSDLYRAEDLIGENVLSQLAAPAAQLLQMPPEELSMANAYLEMRVKALMQAPAADIKKSLSAARLCLYMDVLARLVNPATARRLNRGHVSPFTPVLDKPIREQFLQHCTSASRSGPSANKYTEHKALMHYLALTFVLEARDRVSVDLIHRSLQVSKQELIMFARAVGARYIRNMDLFVKGQLAAAVQDSLEVKFAAGSLGKRSNRR